MQRILLGGAASILDFILYENSHNMVIEDLVGLSLISEVWVVIAVTVDISPRHSTNHWRYFQLHRQVSVNTCGEIDKFR